MPPPPRPSRAGAGCSWLRASRSWSYRPSVGSGGKAWGAHVDLGAEAYPAGAGLGVAVERDALALAEHSEHRRGQGVGGEVVLGAVRVAHHHALRGTGVVGLDDSLPGTSWHRL